MTLSLTDGGETIVAAEEWALAYLALRETIADSSLWKAIVETPLAKWSDVQTLADEATSSRANALAKIFVERADDEGDSLTTPSCIIRQMTPEIAERTGAAFWEIRGSFVVEFILDVPTAYQSIPSVAAIDFANKISRIIKEIRHVDMTNGERMESDTVSLLSAPGQLNPDEFNGDIVRQVELLVTYESADE